MSRFPDRIPIHVPVFGEDGKRHHTFRQSSLKTLEHCMEQARLEMTGRMPKWETDAASLGTAVHTGIEVALSSVIDYGEPEGRNIVIEAAQQEFSASMAMPEFTFIQVNEVRARALIARILTSFYDHTLPTLSPLELEVPFGPLLLFEDDERRIYVTGTIDNVDAVQGILDWKTANREYQPWEYKRWAIQPTVYAWAANETGLVVPDERGITPFTFKVFLKDKAGTLQTLRVERHAGDYEWLMRRTVALAKLIEQTYPEEGVEKLDQWPLGDNGWWCSPKWCPAWEGCKGAHYTTGWPRDSRPSPQAVTFLSSKPTTEEAS